MDTKWRDFSLSIGIKTISMVLSLLLLGCAAGAALSMARYLETNKEVGGWTVDATLSTERYFSHQLMMTMDYAATLAEYGSLDSIRRGEHTGWDVEEEVSSEIVDAEIIEYALVSLTDGSQYGTLGSDQGYDEEMLQFQQDAMFRGAIAQQIEQLGESFYSSLTPEERQAFRNGEYLEWRENRRTEPSVTDIIQYRYTWRGYEVISDSLLEPNDPRLAEWNQTIIAEQESEYTRAQEWLNQRDVVWYAAATRDGETVHFGDSVLRDAADGSGRYSTYAEWTPRAIQCLVEGQSVSATLTYWFQSEQAHMIRAAIPDGTVTDISALLREGQGRIVQAIVWVSVLVLLSLVLLGAAAANTGKRVLPDGSVERSVPRKLWLDVLLTLIVGVWAFIGNVALDTVSVLEYIYDYFAQSGNWNALYLLAALLAMLLGLPVWLWILAVIRRVRAGGWWRHTMVYALLAFLGRSLKRLFRNLPVTVQAILVVLILIAQIFAVAIFVDGNADEIAMFLIPLFFIIDIAFLTMVLVQLRAVEKGAAAAARGEEVQLPSMFGVFGRIGRSLGDLSAGINTAVSERLKSERMKTELITNVSHDIRTPLTGLIAYVDLLQTEGLDSEKALEYVDILAQKANRLKTLTDDLFEASKAASGNVDVQMETLDLAALTRQVLGEMDERIGQSGLDLRVTLPEHILASGDGRLMWRVLENLLDNAIKYSLPSSRVYLEAMEKAGIREACLTLKNISRHPLGQDPWELTERFTRGDESRAGEGSGLGLSIVKSFMDAQGGRLELTADGDLFKACVSLKIEN